MRHISTEERYIRWHGSSISSNNLFIGTLLGPFLISFQNFLMLESICRRTGRHNSTWFILLFMMVFLPARSRLATLIMLPLLLLLLFWGDIDEVDDDDGTDDDDLDGGVGDDEEEAY